MPFAKHTNITELKIDPSKKFRFVGLGNEAYPFQPNDILELALDDGSNAPEFRRISDKRKNWCPLHLLEYADEPTKPVFLKREDLRVGMIVNGAAGTQYCWKVLGTGFNFFPDCRLTKQRPDGGWDKEEVDPQYEGKTQHMCNCSDLDKLTLVQSYQDPTEFSKPWAIPEPIFAPNMWSLGNGGMIATGRMIPTMEYNAARELFEPGKITPITKPTTFMTTLASIYRNLTLSADDKMLIELGLENPAGVPTEYGYEFSREVQYKATRAAMIEAAKLVKAERDAEKK